MPSQVGLYIYGNSLVNFAGGNSQTNVPYWMDQFAQAEGNSLAVSGGYGFLRQFADRDTPGSEWGFGNIQAAWDSESESFSQSSVDTVLITPNNFIQDVAPDQNYAYDTRSPLDVTLEIVADTQAALPAARLFVYEGWSDMAGYTPEVPSTANALGNYHADNQGDYHQWYLDYVNMVNTADPDANVTLIPVASVLSELLSTTLADVPADTFYVDTAPHGTETLYFLASMVTYSSIYGTPVPAGYVVPESVDPSVIAAFPEISDLVYTRVLEASDGTTPPEDIVEEVVDVVDTGEETVDEEQTPVSPPVEDTSSESNNPAVQDSVSAAHGETVLIDVLANDGSDLQLVYVDAPSLGVASVQDGAVQYTAPASGASDLVHYTVQNSAGDYFESSIDVALTDVVDTTVPDVVTDPVDEAVWDEGPAVEDGTSNGFYGTIGVTQGGLYTFDVYADETPGVLIGEQQLDMQPDQYGALVGQTYLEAGSHNFAVYYESGSALEEVSLVVNGPSAPTLHVTGADVTTDPQALSQAEELMAFLQMAEEPTPEPEIELTEAEMEFA